MSTDTTETEPAQRRKPKRRRSYADECQEHERAGAVQQSRLATLLTIVE